MNHLFIYLFIYLSSSGVLRKQRGAVFFLKSADFAEFSIIWHYFVVCRLYNINRDMADDIWRHRMKIFLKLPFFLNDPVSI